MHKTLSNNPSLPLYLVLSSSYLALQSTLLLLSPRLVITLLASNSFRPPTTDLETYLCRALAWSLLAISGFGASCAIALARESEGDDGMFLRHQKFLFCVLCFALPMLSLSSKKSVSSFFGWCDVCYGIDSACYTVVSHD